MLDRAIMTLAFWLSFEVSFFALAITFGAIRSAVVAPGPAGWANTIAIAVVLVFSLTLAIVFTRSQRRRLGVMSRTVKVVLLALLGFLTVLLFPRPFGFIMEGKVGVGQHA